MEGARLVCKSLGVDGKSFYNSISDFRGASRRLELLAKNENVALYRDFAHSPSKLQATVHAVRQQYPERKLIACMELHTFSSLNEDFLNQYAGTMDEADVPVVFFNPHTIEHKKLKPLTIESVKSAFNNSSIQVFTDSILLQKYLKSLKIENTVFLLMSSGNFNGMNLVDFAKEITGEKSLVQPIG
jgi:UDP-N-acetylmuramate: L-alanyl-gamma-D-glutamyl-meso-diaminopimelate ligase